MQIIDPKANTKEHGIFILGSGSPRRKELLSQVLPDFKVIVSDAEELTMHPDGPIALVQENAKLKARSVAQLHPDCWVLGADTLVALNDRVLGKPKSIEEGCSMLRVLSGETHTVSTGLCLINVEKEYQVSKVDSSRVTFKQLTDPVIDQYFSEVNPLDKAGAYAIQTRPDLIIQKFEGSRTNVIGLPVELLAGWLEDLGITNDGQ
ncbi:MAG: septum formation protein Maf [Opitutae bacterium]|jgi:septum formation protein|nr:septum formation protein Maf [Opitutae bacterium]MDA8824036.1 Maf family protein [Opitutales bacterium]